MKKDDIKLDEGYETFSEGPKFEFPREIFSLTKEVLKNDFIVGMDVKSGRQTMHSKLLDKVADVL